jgi:excisionase family DNA binding protein
MQSGTGSEPAGFLSLTEAAQQLGMSESEVLGLVASGEIAAEVRFTQADLDQYLGGPRSGVVNERTQSEAERVP